MLEKAPNIDKYLFFFGSKTFVLSRREKGGNQHISGMNIVNYSGRRCSILLARSAVFFLILYGS